MRVRGQSDLQPKQYFDVHEILESGPIISIKQHPSLINPKEIKRAIVKRKSKKSRRWKYYMNGM